MVQHLLLMTVGAPLILLAAPVRPFLLGLPSAFMYAFVRPAVRRPVQRIGRTLGRPAVCWCAATRDARGMAYSRGVYGRDAITYVACDSSSRLSSWPACFSGCPSFQARARYFHVGWMVDRRVSVPGYAAVRHPVRIPGVLRARRVPQFISRCHGVSSLSVLEDQQLAGALMWTAVTIVYLTAWGDSQRTVAIAAGGAHDKPSRASDVAFEPVLAVSDASVVLSRPFHGFPHWCPITGGLTKPEVSFLIAVTTAAGFYMASSATPSHVPWAALVRTLVGTLLVSGGAATLNQWMEYPFDGQDAAYCSTGRSPLAASIRIHALLFGGLLSLAGLTYMFSRRRCAAIIAPLLATFVGYLGFYTPLKTTNAPVHACWVAIPGAVPPLIGWTAARGHLDHEAWVTFSFIVFPLAISALHGNCVDVPGRLRSRKLPGPAPSTARDSASRSCKHFCRSPACCP